MKSSANTVHALTHAGRQICMPVAVGHSSNSDQSGYCSDTE